MSNIPESNGELLNRLQEGDEGALAELFSEHRERLKRIVIVRMDRRLRGRADASDVLQEAYIDARQRLRHFIAKPELPFFAWLRQVTIQRLVDTHRHHLGAQMRDARHDVSIDRTASSEVSSASLAVQLVGHLTSPSHTVLRAELIEQVEIGLRQMAPIDREVLVLRHFEELTNNEVAGILGITKAAASNRYVRALSRFGGVLAEVPGLLDDFCANCRTRNPAAVSHDQPR
jgi:RNA polymerase sigma-70 factor, ECF subfamily